MDDITLRGETRVAIAGDWHTSSLWARASLRRIRQAAPDVKTLLHLGDFNLTTNLPWTAYRRALVETMEETGIERILITPGNHDHWGQLSPRFGTHPNAPYVLPKTQSISFLPPGYRFKIAGRSFLSFGGAASPDQERRIEGTNWWPSEEPTTADVDRALQGGTVDVMLSHEAVDGGTKRVDDIIAGPTNKLFTERGLAASARTRSKVTSVWTQVAPTILFHGHMHVQAEGHTKSSRSVYSLAANNQAGNLGLLDLQELLWTWMESPSLAGSSGRRGADWR